MLTEKVECETPTPGKKSTRIDKWKYDVVREAILEVIPQNEVGTLFRDLPGLVKARFPQEQIKKLGSISWYTTSVKLDMEVKGELIRVPGESPQRLVRIVE